MAHYVPETPFQKLLARMSSMPGYLGRTSTRKLRRRYARRAVEDFERVLRRLGPGDLAFDLGANYGEYTVRMAETGAEVHAWEPDPDNFRILCERVAGYPNVTPHMQAIGNESGTVNLYRTKDYHENVRKRSQASSVVFADARMNTDEPIAVEMVSFWDVLEKAPRPVRLIKMDIEGAEWDILERLFAMRERPRFEHLFVEAHEFLDDEKPELLRRYRALAKDIPSPDINLYWP